MTGISITLPTQGGILLVFPNIAPFQNNDIKPIIIAVPIEIVIRRLASIPGVPFISVELYRKNKDQS
jgi:hypothetical protein